MPRSLPIALALFLCSLTVTAAGFPLRKIPFHLAENSILTPLDDAIEPRVFQVAQDDEGFIYFATDSGLIRFTPEAHELVQPTRQKDGYTWTVGVAFRRSGAILKLHPASLDVFAAGGQRLAPYPGAAFEQILAVPGSDQALLADHGGAVVLFDENDRFTPLPLPPSTGAASPIRLLADPQGVIHLLRERSLFRYQPEERRFVGCFSFPRRPTAALVLDRTIVWGDDRGLHRFQGGGVQSIAPALPSPSHLTAGANGALWAAGKWGLALIEGGQTFRMTRAEGLPERITALFNDREGNLWIGTENDSAYQIYNRHLLRLLPEDQPVGCLASVGGVVYAGTANGLYRLERREQGWQALLLHATPEVAIINPAPEGVGLRYFGSLGLFRRDGQGRTKPLLAVPDQTSFIMAGGSDRWGTFWYARLDLQVYWVEQGRSHPFPLNAGTALRTLAFDDRGDVYAVCDDEIVRIDGRSKSVRSRLRGSDFRLAHGDKFCYLLCGSDHFFLATHQVLSRFHLAGDRPVIERQVELPEASPELLTADGQLVVLRAPATLLFLNTTTLAVNRSVDRSQGFSGYFDSYGVVGEDPAGNLFFGTNKNVFLLTRAGMVSPPPPRVRIHLRSLRMGEREIRPFTSLPHHPGHLVAEFWTPHYRDFRRHYQVRIEPLDRDYAPLDEGRNGFEFSGLDDGTFALHVRLPLPGGTLEARELSRLAIAPPLHRRWWFLLLLAAAVSWLGNLLFRGIRHGAARLRAHRRSQFIGPYRIVEEIGHGGMGTVYRAEDVANHRVVALKVLRNVVTDPLTAERFRREGLTYGRIGHPGIVRILGHGEHNGQLYFAMEYLEGESLATLLDRHTPFTLAEGCAIGRGLLGIMQAIHAAGIVHRDLKPGNVFVIRGDGPLEPRLKVLDFGIAKVESLTRITVAGSVEGTIEYIAPESLTGIHQATPAVDYYSFGIVLYHLFFGHTPYDSCHIGQILKRKTEEEVALPSPLPAGFPDSLARLVTALTRRDPQARLCDPQQIAAVLSCRP